MNNKKYQATALCIAIALSLGTLAASADGTYVIKMNVPKLHVVPSEGAPGSGNPGTGTPGNGGSGSGDTGDTGNTTPPQVPLQLSASSLNFGAIAIGASSTVQSITVSNPGDAAAIVSGISVATGGSDFAQSNNCSSVPAKGTCTVNVSMTPSTLGQRAGTLAILSGADPLLVSLAGVGQAVDIQLPATTDMGTVETGTQATQTISITNTGNLAATAFYVALGSGATLPLTNNSCGTAGAPITLAAGASCAVTVSWTPAGRGSLSAPLNAVWAGGTATSTISATATQSTLAVTPAALSVDFGNVAVGSTGTATVSVNNSGPGTTHGLYAGLVNASAVTLVSNTCGISTSKVNLVQGAGCSISLKYTPTAVGSLSGAVLNLRSDALNSNINVTLAGTGQGSAATLQSGDLNFGTVAQQAVYPSKTLVFKNTGTAAMNITGLTTLTPYASISANTCSSTAPNATCSLTVTLATDTQFATISTPVVTAGPVQTASIPFLAAVAYPYTSCKAVLAGTPGAASGVYLIDPDGAGSLPATQVYCDMATDGGGWTLVARIAAGSTAHANTAAVGSVTSPGQAGAGKLSDAFINALMDSTVGIMRLTGDHLGYSNYFKTGGTPFSAVGTAAVRPVSQTLNGTYVSTKSNGAHGGLNAYQSGLASHLVYGPVVATDTCRYGMSGLSPYGWCSAGDSGYLFVR